MTHVILNINSDSGETENWWINFLCQFNGCYASGGVTDIGKELSKWGAEVYCGNMRTSSQIVFASEEDKTFFLLRWS